MLCKRIFPKYPKIAYIPQISFAYHAEFKYEAVCVLETMAPVFILETSLWLDRLMCLKYRHPSKRSTQGQGYGKA